MTKTANAQKSAQKRFQAFVNAGYSLENLPDQKSTNIEERNFYYWLSTMRRAKRGHNKYQIWYSILDSDAVKFGMPGLFDPPKKVLTRLPAL